MVKDLNKGITSITYNHLNLPSVVSKDAKNYIEYIYGCGRGKAAAESYDPMSIINYHINQRHQRLKTGALPPPLTKALKR